MNIIAWFSCGITSAVACKMAIEMYGKDNVTLYYIHIDTAHQDNERFIADCEKWYDKKIKIVKSNKYSDQFDVIEVNRFINSPVGAKCTHELKKKVRQRIERESGEANQVFGFEFSRKKINRAVRFSQQYPQAKPIFPLIERQMTKQMCAEILLKNGIRMPAMYELGFHNNNCIGCVKGGKGYWNKIREHFPDTFDRMAELEMEIGRSCIKGKFLADLTMTEGKHEPPILPDCGTFCEIDFADLIDPITDEILKSPTKIRQLYLF
jgi:3'-phosphoadenosine 5'-phosphosulfate sulfotransferase (PAPS reductase)/FAD synthetase